MCVPQTSYSPFIGGLLSAVQNPPQQMSPSDYLRNILTRETVLIGLFAPVGPAYQALMPAIDRWGNGNAISVSPSGSFAKGTANSSGTDLDLFISIPPSVRNTVEEAYRLLASQLRAHGFAPKLQNVSIGVTVGGLWIDLVPGRLQNPFCADHTIFHRRSNSLRKTNVAKHVMHVRSSGRQNEIRILKLWRDQNGFEFPSFYLELATIRALEGSGSDLAANVSQCLEYLSTKFITARFEDPANTANIVSNDLTNAEKLRIQTLARRALALPWTSLVR
jgi:hypothetical protein